MMYTSGPWTHSPQIGDDKACFRALVLGADGNVIATMEVTNDERVATANARLMAMSTEMLEALQAAMRIVDLWLPGGDVSEEHEEETKTLSLMAMMFENVIEKAIGTDDKTSVRVDHV